MQQTGIFLHMRRELFQNGINLPVVHFARYLLREQKVIEHRCIAALYGDRLFRLHGGLIGCGGDVFVFAQLLIEGLGRGAAHLGAGVVFVAVLVQGIAQQVLLALGRERGKAHIGQLCHVVDLIRRLQRRRERRQNTLGFGLQLIGLLAQQFFQQRAARLVEGGGFTQHGLVAGQKLAVDKA